MSKQQEVSGDKFNRHSQCLPISAIHAQISFIQGKVLTIVDATSASDAQNKAIKDLIKDAFRTQQNWISSLALGRDNGGDLLAYSGLSQ